jgi:agmatine/peptidylarginine deiminase
MAGRPCDFPAGKRGAPARALITPLYPARTVVGMDVRNLYENGGMVHCVTQQRQIPCTPAGV